LTTDKAERPRTLTFRPQNGTAPFGSLCGYGLATALTLALSSLPAAARTFGYGYYGSSFGYPAAHHKAAHKEHKETDHASKEPFGDAPKGPVEIFVSIDQQKLHLYSDGVHVADTSVATGVPALPTPLGVFSVIQKQVFHRSNIYSGAPMPFMQRITWSGVAMHEGESIGHRASHGCIRMPGDFARRLYSFTRLGARVVVANAELRPSDFADPHLFVHKDIPPEQAAAPMPPEPVKTAQTVDGSKTIDTASSDLPKPTELGLRVNNDGGSDAAKSAAATDPPKPDQPAAADASAPGNAAPAATVPMPLDKPATLVQDAPARNTPISIFISRKEKRLYVRQNFAPLFDVPVTIERPDQPLGTHVFTALGLTADNKTFRWNVVTMPTEQPRSSRHADDEDRSGRHGKHARGAGDEKPAAAPLPPQSPADALARIEIPQDVVDHIAEMMVAGSSLIVSDHGLGDETGEGTDFIVVTR
jgi:hypothetical protein